MQTADNGPRNASLRRQSSAEPRPGDRTLAFPEIHVQTDRQTLIAHHNSLLCTLTGARTTDEIGLGQALMMLVWPAAYRVCGTARSDRSVDMISALCTGPHAVGAVNGVQFRELGANSDAV